jgi:hypothetical protein
VTPAGLKQLAVLKQLETLSLSSMNLTDVGLKEMGALQQLRVLNLFHTKVTEAGLDELMKALPKCAINH